jgi:hypothetical protein
LRSVADVGVDCLKDIINLLNELVLCQMRVTR